MDLWSQHSQGRAVGLHTPRAGADRDAPALVCVHGSGGGGAEFLPLLDALAPGVAGAAVDLPGHGATPGPPCPSVEEYAAWVAELIAAGPLRPVLLGNSLGGAIALTVGLTRPELVSGLVLWGTGGRLRVLPAILEGLAHDFGPTVDMLTDLAYAQTTEPALKEVGRAAMNACPPAVILNDYAACDRFDVMERLGDIDLPTLVVCGDDDRLTPVKYSRHLAQEIPGAELVVIPGAGHLIHQEQPRAGARAIADFLGRL